MFGGTAKPQVSLLTSGKAKCQSPRFAGPSSKSERWIRKPGLRADRWLSG